MTGIDAVEHQPVGQPAGLLAGLLGEAVGGRAGEEHRHGEYGEYFHPGLTVMVDGAQMEMIAVLKKSRPSEWLRFTSGNVS